VKHYSITTEQQGTVTFTGTLLGHASSESRFHNHDTDYVSSGFDGNGRKIKCSACRWHEATIYRDENGGFVLHTVGRTIIPGEVDFAKVSRTTSAYELEEMMVVRGDKPYRPRTSAQALAQAAALDEDIRDAYVNRAVV
jgi:hypothetical protein